MSSRLLLLSEAGSLLVHIIMYKHITCKYNNNVQKYYYVVPINLHPFQCWAHLPTVDEVK